MLTVGVGLSSVEAFTHGAKAATWESPDPAQKCSKGVNKLEDMIVKNGWDKKGAVKTFLDKEQIEIRSTPFKIKNWDCLVQICYWYFKANKDLFSPLLPTPFFFPSLLLHSCLLYFFHSCVLPFWLSSIHTLNSDPSASTSQVFGLYATCLTLASASFSTFFFLIALYPNCW